MLTYIRIFIALTLTGSALFYWISPEFGQKPKQEYREIYSKLPNYKDGTFHNTKKINMDMSFKDMRKLMKEFMNPSEEIAPKINIPVTKLAGNFQKDSINKLIWFGHSSFILRIDGKTLLFDPVFNDNVSPVPFFGRKRFSKNYVVNPEDLDTIDAIIISHDHYDHLDYSSIKKLKDKTKRFITPLGVASHLRSWNIPEDKITELNWWQKTQIDSIQLVLTPSQHFSGRGLSDRNTTLWGSWTILGTKNKIYFSGDGGYGPHFSEIGEKYGPFDLALMECGQYNQKWHDIHMFPEETLQASKDIGAKNVLPVHWGAFTLALHDWTDPVERAVKVAKEQNIHLITPTIGQNLIIDSLSNLKTSKWWEEYSD